MAIVQISKIQQRSGNLVDLPQLDDAEFGWASDQQRLFIGRTGSNINPENVEVLTSYSNISFSQIAGSDGGNFNITAAENGQLLTYVASTDTWENFTGTSQLSGGKLQLGDASNISITGAAGIGYVLETDGTGNLSWTPKGTLYTRIVNLTNNPTGNVITMKVPNTTPYTNQQSITITNANISNSGANSNINGQTFYVKLATDYASTGNVTLYTDATLLTTANGAGLTTYTANSGVATAVITSGGGGGTAGGATNSIQYNSSGIITGDANLVWDFTSKQFTVGGNANITSNVNVTGNINLSRQLISTLATGTAPLIVTSTTQVANLNVATAGVAGTVTTAAQPNITSVGTLTSLSVTGNITGGNLVGPFASGNSNISITSNSNISMYVNGNANVRFAVTDTGANVAGTFNASGNANVGNLGTSTAIITTGNITTINSSLLQNGNSNVTITANGNVTMYVAGNATARVTATSTGANVTGTLGVSGNANVGNLGTAQVLASANVTAPQLISNIAVGTAPLVVTSTTKVANLNADTLDGYDTATAATANTVAVRDANGSLTANVFIGTIAGANVTGTVANATYATSAGSATTAGTVTTNAQPNITSVSSSFTSLTFANAQTISGNNMTLTTGANTNTGTITGDWTLSTGSKLQATYADLAEYYEADQPYAPGTVLQFGGDKEVTIAEDGTSRVAGVVSTDPAYVMNSGCEGDAVAIALQGRVPTKVRGTIRKGDMMVSAGNGYARPSVSPIMGSVIGKALENFDGIEGVIEVAVGRL